MKRWVGAAIIFGALAALFMVGSMLASRSPDFIGVKFGPSGRSGFATTDRAGAMGFAAFISGVLCLGSVAAAVRAKRHKVEVDEDNNRNSEGP
jgi:hypothetical protein